MLSALPQPATFGEDPYHVTDVSESELREHQLDQETIDFIPRLTNHIRFPQRKDAATESVVAV